MNFHARLSTGRRAVVRPRTRQGLISVNGAAGPLSTIYLVSSNTDRVQRHSPPPTPDPVTNMSLANQADGHEPKNVDVCAQDKRAGFKLASRIRQVLQANYGTFRGWVRLVLGQLEFFSGRLDAHLELPALQVHRLVFVCLGNINRSPFAAEVARAQGMQVCSIGLATTTGVPAFPSAVLTAQRFGIDLSAHAATDISDYIYQPGDLLLAMEVRHIRQLITRGVPARAIAPLGHWASPHRIHLHDPHTLSDAYFRTCFALIHSAVINLSEELHCARR